MKYKEYLIFLIVVALCLGFLNYKKPYKNAAKAAHSQAKITLDDTNITAIYTNCVDAKGTPEEIIFDLALFEYDDIQGINTTKSIKRIVVNYFTAKRLTIALDQTIKRHEQNFGMIEINLSKKLSPKASSKERELAREFENAQIIIDGYQSKPEYANICRVTGTPEEVIIDFALNPNPFGLKDQIIKIGTRVVLNYNTSKRLYIIFEKVIKQYETNYGIIELDVQRRLKVK